MREPPEQAPPPPTPCPSALVVTTTLAEKLPECTKEALLLILFVDVPNPVGQFGLRLPVSKSPLTTMLASGASGAAGWLATMVPATPDGLLANAPLPIPNPATTARASNPNA